MPGLPGSPATTANVAPFSKTGGGSPHLSSEGGDMICAGDCTPWLAAPPIIAAKNAVPQKMNLRMIFSFPNARPTPGACRVPDIAPSADRCKWLITNPYVSRPFQAAPQYT